MKRLLLTILFVHYVNANVKFGEGYGCIVQCVGDCLTRRMGKQVRDCRIKCKKADGSALCLENDDKCRNLCRDVKGDLVEDQGPAPDVAAEEISSSPKLTTLHWKHVDNAVFYIIRFKLSSASDSSWMYQETLETKFSHLRPRACSSYDYQVAFVTQQKNTTAVSKFSQLLAIDGPVPAWSKLMSAEPTELFLKDEPYIDPSSQTSLDHTTVFFRMQIFLPTGWNENDFGEIGKHWHVKECLRDTSETNAVFVTFNKIMKYGSDYFVEAKFPGYLARNKCTLANQMKTITLCNKSYGLPIDTESTHFKDGVYKLMLDCTTVSNMKCAEETHTDEPVRIQRSGLLKCQGVPKEVNIVVDSKIDKYNKTFSEVRVGWTQLKTVDGGEKAEKPRIVALRSVPSEKENRMAEWLSSKKTPIMDKMNEIRLNCTLFPCENTAITMTNFKQGRHYYVQLCSISDNVDDGSSVNWDDIPKHNVDLTNS